MTLINVSRCSSAVFQKGKKVMGDLRTEGVYNGRKNKKHPSMILERKCEGEDGAVLTPSSHFVVLH